MARKSADVDFEKKNPFSVIIWSLDLVMTDWSDRPFPGFPSHIPGHLD